MHDITLSEGENIDSTDSADLAVGGKIEFSQPADLCDDSVRGKSVTPPSDPLFSPLLEAVSDKDDLISPFSSRLNVEKGIHGGDKLDFLSLQPCRKVTIVVRVLPVDDSMFQNQNCIYPCGTTSTQSRRWLLRWHR